MKKFLTYFLLLILTVIIFFGCQSTIDPECGLFYGDSLDLYVGQKVYSCDSAWFYLDSIVSDTRNATDSTGELVIALSYQIYGTDYHQQFSTVDTRVESPNFTGYKFLLINAFSEDSPGSDHYLRVYDIYPKQAVNITLFDNRYCLSCIFTRDIEG